jgi:hypothetical protein
VCALGQGPLKPWPDAFSVNFSATVFNTSNPFVTIAGSAALMRYDWNARAQLLSFSHGCPVDVSAGPCVFLFNRTAGYLVKDGQCCRQAIVGPPAPSWVSNLKFVDETYAYNTKVMV